MNGQRIRRISIWLVTALYLLACVSPFMAAPAAPTQMPVETIIIQTAAAAQTQTAIFLPTVTLTPTPTFTLTPTITPTPTPTFIPPAIIMTDLPTATPTVTFVITQAVTASSGDGTSDEDEAEEDEKNSYASVVDKEWACTVLERYPKNGTIIGAGVRFSAVWVLLNRGSRTWPNNSVDFVYRGGVRNEGRARFDLPTTVISGGKISLDVTMIAPEKPGAYRTLWILRVGRTSFCKMAVNFVVR